MKKTISQRFMALALAACLVLGLCICPKVEAVTDNWQTVYSQTSTKVEADANDPFDATFVTRASAYYTKKIDVVTGTKISFDVRFPAVTSGETLQYGIALMDRPNATHGYANIGNGGSANGLAVELVSAATATTISATATKWSNGARGTWANNSITSALGARGATDAYNFTFEKLDDTGANSWQITIVRPDGTVAGRSYPASEIPHNLFAGGAYVAMSCMNSGTHSLALSNLVVTQPNTASNWKTIQKNSDATLAQVDSNVFDATFTNHVTGYYNQKINVKEGTTVSFRVNFPAMTDGANLQYGFALVDRAGSFYASNNTASSIQLELASVSSVASGALTAGAAKKFAGATTRTLLGYATANLANPRNTTDVYDVTFKKINETISDVNYSWSVSVIKNGTTPYIYRYKASDVPHDLFENGAYFAMGSMAQFNKHTVKVSDFLVNNSWSSVAPAGTVIPGRDLVPEGEYSFNASFRNKAAGTYDRAIQVQEGTKISMKTKLVATTAGQAMWFGVSLADRANAFYNVDTTANALVLELGNNTATTTNMPSVVSKKIPGGGSNNRIWVANVGTLAGSRATNMIYTITFEKLAATEANSWKVTVNNGTTDFTASIGTDKVAHDMLGDEVYIAAGFMSAVNGHNIDLFDLSVTQPDAVAAVDTVEYGTIGQAVENAFKGETVELLKDVALAEALDLTDKAVALDLNGKTLSGAENLTLGAGTDLTLKGGSLEGKLALAESGAKITADCPISLELNGKDATVNASDVTLTDAATDNVSSACKYSTSFKTYCQTMSVNSTLSTVTACRFCAKNPHIIISRTEDPVLLTTKLFVGFF